MSGSIGLDIRAPIGGLFSVLGVMLAIYGAATGESNSRAGININLWWGVVMLVFGVALLAMARRAMASGASVDDGLPRGEP